MLRHLLPFMFLFVLSLFFFACTVTPEVFHEDIELDELEMEHDILPITVKISPVERKRSGVRVGFSDKEVPVRGFFQVYDEEFDEDYDGNGFGGGAEGEPVIQELEDRINLILPFKLGMNVSWADYEEGALESDILYFEWEGQLGFGVDIYGAQPSAGIYLSSLIGTVEAESGGTSADYDIDGANFGTYVGVRYRSEDVPVTASVMFYSGDVDGVMGSLGFTF